MMTQIVERLKNLKRKQVSIASTLETLHPYRLSLHHNKIIRDINSFSPSTKKSEIKIKNSRHVIKKEISRK